MASGEFTIACMACARTRISLDTTRFFAEFAASLKILDAVRVGLQDQFAGARVTCPMRNGRRDGTLYASLAESSSDVYSLPLLVVDGIVVEAPERAACTALLGAAGGREFIAPEHVRLSVYDNTIAILEWDLVGLADGRGIIQRVPPRDVDEITSNISMELIAGAAGGYINWLESALANAHLGQGAGARDLAKVFRNPHKLDLFFDVDARRAGAASNHLWTSRTALLPGLESLDDPAGRDWYRRWAEADGERIELGSDCDCRIGWGNNAIAGRGCVRQLEDFLALQRRLEFFYATTIIHNRNVTELLTRGFMASGRAARGIIRRHRLISLNLDYSAALIFDTENGLQGNKYKIFTAFFAQWRFQKLLDGTQRKARLADAALSRKLAERRVTLQRNLKALLVALSAVEVIGVVIGLINLAYSREAAQGSWGLLQLIHAGSPDMIVTIAIVLLAILAVFIVVFGIQSGEE